MAMRVAKSPVRTLRQTRASRFGNSGPRHDDRLPIRQAIEGLGAGDPPNQDLGVGRSIRPERRRNARFGQSGQSFRLLGNGRVSEVRPQAPCGGAVSGVSNPATLPVALNAYASVDLGRDGRQAIPRSVDCPETRSVLGRTILAPASLRPLPDALESPESAVSFSRRKLQMGGVKDFEWVNTVTSIAKAVTLR